MDSSTPTPSRRSFLTGSAATAAAFTIVEPQLVRGWGSEKLKVGLIGCGSRGTEAIYNTMVGDRARNSSPWPTSSRIISRAA